MAAAIALLDAGLVGGLSVPTLPVQRVALVLRGARALLDVGSRLHPLVCLTLAAVIGGCAQEWNHNSFSLCFSRLSPQLSLPWCESRVSS